MFGYIFVKQMTTHVNMCAMMVLITRLDGRRLGPQGQAASNPDAVMSKHGHGQYVIFLYYENCNSEHMLSIFMQKTLELFIVYTTKLIDVYQDS